MLLDKRETEVMRRLCLELTHDVLNLKGKGWLKPALASHISHLTEIDHAKVTWFVDQWFPS